MDMRSVFPTCNCALRWMFALTISLAITAGGSACAHGAEGEADVLVTSNAAADASSVQDETPAPEAAPAENRLPIGMNLAPMSAGNRELVFVDVMKMATRWFDFEEAKATGGRPRRAGRGQGQGQPRGGGRRGGEGRTGGDGQTGEQAPRARQGRLPYTTVPVDEHGWPRPEPGKGATAFMLRDMEGHYPGGTYICTWEGTAKISFSGAARAVARGDHRIEVLVTPSRDQVGLTVRDFDPNDPVRNIRFWMPGFEDAKSPFNPRFLERVQPFSVLRFWPWSKVNLATGAWDARATLDSAIQTGKEGVAVEYMVDLCNELGATPWFLMPHLADDEYVRNFATIVKERLRPDLSIYVEYSNEVWNSDYPSARWAREVAQKEGVRAPEITAREAARDWRIWHEVFGEEKNRVIRVAAGHLYNPQVCRIMAETLGDEVDALAIAAYFGLKAKAEGFNHQTPASDIMAAARRNLDSLVIERIGQHKKIADRLGEKIGRHVPLISYEAGPHIVARQSLTPGNMRMALSPDAVSAVQDLPAMYDAIRTLMKKGQEAGLELYVAYYFIGPRNHSDSFAHLLYLDQPIEEAPKFRAVVEDWID